MNRVGTLICCAVFAAAGPGAHAAVAPNPGDSTVITNSTTATATYVVNPVTNRVADFATTITALLNGNPVYTAVYSAPFADPVVQAAVAAADSFLTLNGASFGAPILASTSTSSISTTAPPVIPSLSCAQLRSGAFGAYARANVTATDTFGPATIAVGDCRADTFAILPGQLDANINTDFGYDVPVNAVTTVTNTTTQVYDIFGFTSATSPVPVSVPEPGTAALLLAGAGAVVLRRCRR